MAEVSNPPNGDNGDKGGKDEKRKSTRRDPLRKRGKLSDKIPHPRHPVD